LQLEEANKEHLKQEDGAVVVGHVQRREAWLVDMTVPWLGMYRCQHPSERQISEQGESIYIRAVHAVNTHKSHGPGTNLD
jgi:hypothetical protein